MGQSFKNYHVHLLISSLQHWILHPKNNAQFYRVLNLNFACYLCPKCDLMMPVCIILSFMDHVSMKTWKEETVLSLPKKKKKKNIKIYVLLREMIRILALCVQSLNYGTIISMCSLTCRKKSNCIIFCKRKAWKEKKKMS